MSWEKEVLLGAKKLIWLGLHQHQNLAVRIFKLISQAYVCHRIESRILKVEENVTQFYTCVSVVTQAHISFIATIIMYHYLSGMKEHSFIILAFSEIRSPKEFPRKLNQGVAGTASRGTSTLIFPSL